MELTVKVLSALQKVFLDEEPTQPEDEHGHAGFENETVSFQIAYKAQPGAKQIRKFITVEVDSPIAECIRVRRVHHVPVGFATFPDADDNYLRKSPGMYPDLLMDWRESQLRVWQEQWHSLWIDVEGASAGEHPVALRLVSEDGDTIGEAQTRVTILPGNLPPQQLIHTKWLHCDCLAQYYQEPVWSDRHWDIVENFIRHAVRRGMNMMLTPIHTPPLDTDVGGERMTTQLVDIRREGGTYHFGFSKVRRWVEICLRCGVEYFEMAHLFTQWGAKFTPKIMAVVDGVEKRIFGWDVPATGGEYADFLSAYLPALIAELRELGIADRTYFHISDEPEPEHLQTYTAAKSIAEPYLQGFTIIDALSSFEFYQKGIIKKPIPGSSHIQPFLDGAVEGLWTYYCISQYKDVSNVFMAMPSARNRIFGLQLYKYQIEGILQWAYNFYNAQFSAYPVDPFAVTDADGFTPSGDAFQVYPGADGMPLDSLRVMVTQQALYDLRACQWLESLTSREYVIDLIEGQGKTPITFAEYPQSDGYLLTTRKRINQEICARI